MLRIDKSELKCLLEPSMPIPNSQRREIIRLLFRTLINSIYKNDPNLGNFNVNYISSSRKIIDSTLF